MFGGDFFDLWQIGQAVLHGLSPYSVAVAKYPPAANLFFVLFALLPFSAAFPLWTGASVVMLIDVLRRCCRKNYLAALFIPVVFTLISGQVDLFFLWLTSWLAAGGLRAVFAAVLLTLKPQIALVVLPWLLLRWLREDRRSLFRWIGLCIILHTLPLVFSPQIYAQWFGTVGPSASMRLSLSAGIFALAALPVPLWLLVSLSGLLITGGLLACGILPRIPFPKNEDLARAFFMLASPVTLWYDGVILLDSAPAKILIPLSWAAFALSAVFASSIPLALIPLYVLLWQISRIRRSGPVSTVLEVQALSGTRMTE